MSRKRSEPNAENATLADLEAAARAAVSKRSAVRLRAIKALLIGIAFEQVMELFEAAERTLRGWVRAFNEQGIDGLVERDHPGAPRLIDEELAGKLHDLIKHPGKAGQEHWTARKFHGYVKNNIGLEVSYTTVWRLFHERGFSLQVPRPWPDRQDEQARELFRQQIARLMQDKGVELWFQDEMGVEGDPRPRQRWAEKGSKPTVTKNGDHLRTNVCGMVCPRTGETFMLEFPHVDGEVFQVFLDEANKDITFERKRQVLVMDNASWHKLAGLRFGRMEPMYLPAYSPDLNPIERLWHVIKAEWFRDFVARTREELVERVCKAARWLMDRREENIQTCRIRRII